MLRLSEILPKIFDKKQDKKRIGSVFNKKNLLLTFNAGNAISYLYADSLKDLKEMKIRDDITTLFKINRRKYLLEKNKHWKSNFQIYTKQTYSMVIFSRAV